MKVPRVFHLPEPLGAITALGQDASFGFHNRQLVAHPMPAKPTE